MKPWVDALDPLKQLLRARGCLVLCPERHFDGLGRCVASTAFSFAASLIQNPLRAYINQFTQH
jgi:hypothetical protein